MAPNDPGRPRPFDDLRRALSTSSDDEAAVPLAVRTDPGRIVRTGVPEVVYGAGKSADQILSALRGLIAANGVAIATRCSPAMIADVVSALGDGVVTVEIDVTAGVIEVRDVETPRHIQMGLIGIIAAGTSDLPVCREVELLARFFGANARVISDVGVAGLHRLAAPLESLVANDTDIIVVVAGMDGALPSVVAGLVDVPVIGVPTSTGYGFGGDGTAALMSMLQSCAPGLTVVNIDNGVGAAAAAWRVVRQRHAPRG